MVVEERVRSYREVVGSELRLNLHNGQQRVMDSGARFPFMLGGPQCLSPDEYIYTPDGVKLVGGVEDGDRILGGVVSGREEYLGQTYEIVFSNGIKLKVSGEHPFWYKKTLRCPARWATCHDLRGRTKGTIDGVYRSSMKKQKKE